MVEWISETPPCVASLEQEVVEKEVSLKLPAAQLPEVM
jgi:hypothetical protein